MLQKVVRDYFLQLCFNLIKCKRCERKEAKHVKLAQFLLQEEMFCMSVPKSKDGERGRQAGEGGDKKGRRGSRGRAKGRSAGRRVQSFQQKGIYIQQLLLMKRTGKGQAHKGVECTICMQRESNCDLNGCVHQFCIRCIKKWSKNKNTCPLCRERFHQIKYRNKVIEVAPPTPQIRPQRVVPYEPPQQQRRIIYVPMMLYPQTNCFIYSPSTNYFLTSQGVDENTGVRYSLGSPAFFIPTL